MIIIVLLYFIIALVVFVSPTFTVNDHSDKLYKHIIFESINLTPSGLHIKQ